MRKRILSGLIVMAIMFSLLPQTILFAKDDDVTHNSVELYSSTISSSSIEKAVDYGYYVMNTAPASLRGYCAAFVWRCYNYGAKIGNSSYATARQMGDALITHIDGNPPRGAFVFWYDSRNPSYAAGHVGLSLGDGKVIHAYPNIQVTTISYVNGGHYIYRGWGAPIAGYNLATEQQEPPHIHSWETGYDSSHPHRQYKYCSGCGSKEYTGKTRSVSDCRQCYPLGTASLTRSYDKVHGTATFYRNNVKNANSYLLTIYKDGSRYGNWDIDSTSKTVTHLPSGNYYAKLTIENKNTGETKTASCNSFRIVDTYNVSYNANGGTNAPSSQTKIQDETLTLTSSTPRRAHYIFKGWASSKTAKDAQYSAGSTYTKNAKITLYAVWEPEVYTIRFDANGGKGELTDTTITYGNTMRMPNSVIKEGFFLKGWSTNKDATTAEYRLNMDYKLDANTTLYAVWGSSTWGGSVANAFAGGDGTEENPYQISNAAELAYLAKTVNESQAAPEYKHYILTDNISLGYEEWVPIGVYDNENQYFTGSFDGNGYTISDLSISNVNSGYLGIFGYTKDSTIKNITVTGDIAGITTNLLLNVGAIAGCSDHITAENCNGSYINVSDISTTSSDGSRIGSLFGRAAYNSSISDCEAYECYVSVKEGTYDIGMITGNINGNIYRCEVKSSGELLGTLPTTNAVCAGGVVGTQTGTIRECKVDTGFLSGTMRSASKLYVGGLVGWINDDGKIELCSVNFNDGLTKNIDGNSYQSSIIAASSGTSNLTCVGGIVGVTKTGVQISNCKYNGQSISATSQQHTEVGGIVGNANGSTTEKVAAQGGVPLNRDLLPKRDGYKATWYTDSEFRNEYDFTQNVSADETLYAKWDKFEPEVWDGTTEEPAYNADTKTYTVANAKQLAWIAGVVNSEITTGTNMPSKISFNGYTIELTNDIYLNDVSNFDDWGKTPPVNSWSPMGSTDISFAGILNGNGYSIYGLYTVDPDNIKAGLIGYLTGTVKNITLSDSIVAGTRDIGGIVGYNNKGIVENCRNNSDVYLFDNGAYAGGIIGHNEGIINNSINTGNVCNVKTHNNKKIETTLNDVGGICGANEISGNIKNCYNFTDIGDNDNRSYVFWSAGGICGANMGHIENCGNVKATITSGHNNAGGICGYNLSGGTISYCFNTGNTVVWENYNCSGGIVGENQGEVSYCYSSDGIIKGAAHVGGIVGANGEAATVKYCYSAISSQSTGSYRYGVVVGNLYGIMNYCYGIRSPLYGYNAGNVSNSSVVSNMKSLSNLSGFSTSTWAVNSNVNNGYPYVKVLEEVHKSYTMTVVEDVDAIPINRVFANVNGIIYSQSSKLAQAGGIFGHVGATGVETSPARNMLAIADRVSSVSSGSSYFANTGDIVGEMTNDAFDFSDIYSYSSMDLSAVNSAKAANASTSNISSARTLAQLKRLSFLRQTFGEPYQSLAYLEEHPDAVWVLKDGELPELYFNVLNDITVSETENGSIAVDRTRAVDDEIVNVTATPAEGYELNKIYVNGKEIDGTTFAVKGDSDVYATFIEPTPEFNVEINAGENATATLTNVDEADVTLSSVGDIKLFEAPVTELTASDGEEIKVTAAADEDYTIDAIYVNGEEIAGDSFILTDNTNVTLEVASVSTDTKAVTNDAENVGSYFATLSGSVSSDSEGVSRYIRYWEKDNPDEVFTTDVEDGTGEYSVEVTDFKPLTTYQYQLTEYGEIKEFTTIEPENQFDVNDEATTEPTTEPTTSPRPEPTSEPTTEPTTEPTASPTLEPTEEPIKRDMCFEITNQTKGDELVSADVVNTTETVQSGLIICAAYDGDGKLISVNFEPITDLAANGNYPAEFAVVNGAVKYKFLVWDSWKTMLPVAASITIE